MNGRKSSLEPFEASHLVPFGNVRLTRIGAIQLRLSGKSCHVDVATASSLPSSPVMRDSR